MIFNPTRGGGSEKEYTITARNNITVSATKLKPGHVFQAQKPDTVKGTNKMLTGDFLFVMPCADVTITY